jgi:hypothetical protein
MAKEIRNIGASVRARLLQIAKASGQSFDLVLTRFALERCFSGSVSHPCRPLCAEGRDADDELGTPPFPFAILSRGSP